MDATEKKLLWRKTLFYTGLTTIIYIIMFIGNKKIPMTPQVIDGNDLTIPFSISRIFDLPYFFFIFLIKGCFDGRNFEKNRFTETLYPFYLYATLLGPLVCMVWGAVAGTITFLGFLITGLVIGPIAYINPIKDIKNWWYDENNH